MGISLVVADDQQIIRYGVRSLLEGTDIDVVGEAASGREAIALLEKLQPDVLLLDVRLPEAKGRRIDTGGLKTLEQVSDTLPDVKTIMFSCYENPIYIARSVALGACDFIYKSAVQEVLVEVIRSAFTEHSPSLNGQMRRIAALLNLRQTFSDNMVLTKRETQILRQVAFGLNNREICRLLGVSNNTIKEHVQNIFRKLQVEDRTRAAVWAVRNGLV